MISTGGFGFLLNVMRVPGYGDINIMFINVLSATPGGTAPQITGTLHTLLFSMQIASIFDDWVVPIALFVAEAYALSK